MLYLLFLLSFASYSQHYRLINKAAKIIDTEKPDKQRVLRILKRAKKADYGFCLMGSWDAYLKIDYLTAKLYYKIGDYQHSLELLDALPYDESNKGDSLKVVCLTKIYGANTMYKLISANASQIIKRGKQHDYTPICMYLEDIKYIFCFRDQNENLDYKNELTAWEVIKETNFYTILKNNEQGIMNGNN